MFGLIALQPDFGGAAIIFFIWFGMTVVSGISKKHLLLVGAVGVVAFLGLWFFVFAPYQKDRIINFLNPMADIHGSGYNVFQSTIAVGSGQVVGKGLGFGTQSRLKFLPEPETDFIFAAFSEEWGFVGSFVELFCCSVVLIFDCFVFVFVSLALSLVLRLVLCLVLRLVLCLVLRLVLCLVLCFILIVTGKQIGRAHV